MVSLRPLGIQHDPESQGYTWHDYDLIVVNGIPDLSQDMDDAVVNIFKLLSENGEIIFLHQRRLPLYYCLIFGTLPGWIPGKYALYIRGLDLYNGEGDKEALVDDMESTSVLRKRCQKILQHRKSARTNGCTPAAANDCAVSSVGSSDTLNPNTSFLNDTENPLQSSLQVSAPPPTPSTNNQPTNKTSDKKKKKKPHTATTLVTKLATLLAIGEQTIYPSATLASYGFDSLLAADLGSWIQNF